MAEVTRREALLGMVAAAGAIGLAAPRAAAGEEGESGAAAAARRLAPAPARHGESIVCRARVTLCRSWDRHVYLVAGERLQGFVATTPEGFAIAAACQAAGRPVAAEVWGHEPGFDGAGRFAGALLALDLRDLPGGAQVEA